MATVWLSSLLSFWLLLTVARQVFDLIGRLWIPVAFNLLQLVCIICGLFGSCQRRLGLLITFSVSCIISIAQNTLITLWYLGVFGDRGRPLLSAGLPYSFSFFLRFTPFCDSHFDLVRSRWVQSPCPLPYYHLEAALAILNILIAVVCIFLSMHIIFQTRREEKEPKTPMPSAYSHVSRGKLPTAPSSLNDISSGYMNSSYEEVNEVHIHPQPPPDDPPRVRGFERNSRKKQRGKPRPQSMPQPDVYSSAETEQMNREDFYTKPVKTASGRFKKQREEPLPRRNTVGESEKRPSRSSSVNTTSLVSFDPKSGTLLRVREHLDSDDDYGTRRERPVDVEPMYERIKPREQDLKPIPLAGSRTKNVSQDSVPSALAPVFVSPTADGSSCDSGIPSSSCEQWPPAAQPIMDLANIGSPGIRLSEYGPVPSPGIRLSSAVALEKKRSSFQVQMPKESRRVIGHYHAANEFPLTGNEEQPVISGRSLLV